MATVVLINQGAYRPRYMVVWDSRSILDDARFTVVEQRHDEFYDVYWWCMKHKSAACGCVREVIVERTALGLEKPPED